MDNGKICFIIFSKDRSMQLHALLSSLIYYVRGSFSVYVLYHVDGEQEDGSYKQLINDFKEDSRVHFYKQGKSFKDDLIEIVGGLDADRIFFLVDDIVFKNTIDLKELANIRVNKELFSLRHGNHLDYSYVVSKKQKLPELKKRDEHLLTWEWSKGELDWAYPLSVDGHLFNATDVRFWVKNLRFFSPNSFELSLQYLKRFYIELSGVCYKSSIIFNNPCNKVQSEIANNYGKMHQDELLKLWTNGYIINFKLLEGYKNTGVHEEVTFILEKRTDLK